MKNSKKKEKTTGILCFNKLKTMERENDYDNDGKGNICDDDDDTYFPPEESEPPHY